MQTKLNLRTAIKVLIIVLMFSSKIASASDLKDVIPYLKTSSSDSFVKQMDMDYLEGCPVLINQGRGDKKTGKLKKGEWNDTGISQTWLIANSTWEIHSGIGLDHPEFKSTKIGAKADKNQKHSLKNWELVYVGPWKHIEKLNKQIRLVSIQLNELNTKTGGMMNFYESMDEENQKIPKKPLKLIKPTYGDELCILKWHNKYGYNAIAETYQQLRPGFWAWFFRDYETVVTGKIIQAEE